MPRLDRHPSTAIPNYFEGYSVWNSIGAWSAERLNFYRIHLLYFIFTPLLASGIFYASNSQNHISYIDSLFMCISCMTVTGLNSVLLHDISTFQQVILFIMMVMGSTSTVSVITIIVRKYFFQLKFDYHQKRDLNRRRLEQSLEAGDVAQSTSLSKPIVTFTELKPKKKSKAIKLSTDMIRRTDIPVRVNSMNTGGWLRDEEPKILDGIMVTEPEEMDAGSSTATGSDVKDPAETELKPMVVRIDEPENVPIRDSSKRRESSIVSLEVESAFKPKYFPRSRTIEFLDDDSPLRNRRPRSASVNPDFLRGSMDTSFGGFPNPIAAAFNYTRQHVQPIRKLERTITIPRSKSFVASQEIGISFDAEVGRNSSFKNLTAAQREELGGVEYRALSSLLYIVIGYWFFSQMLSVLILAPYFTAQAKTNPEFNSLFITDPTSNVNPTWFTFFQVFSAWSNNGMSLIDKSMIPFQTTYLLIIIMCFMIIGGNTAFPIFLRLTIFIISKLTRSSRYRETLQFLLDHPRRCFIYLFPSHQTWFLVFVLTLLNSIDWISFLVLDTQNSVVASLPVGTRIIDGLFQSFAVRAAGFSIVPLSGTAPALQFIFVVMMYISVFPIALSIRSTNVYEEKSLGVFEDEDAKDDEVEAEFDKKGGSTSYIAYHARKQLSFDLWWIILGIWLICIIERQSIEDVTKGYLTVFTIVFELISAYATCGLSLGNAVTDTSLAGQLSTLSKLVLIAVMIRGRHRGLPLSLDRAVLLPSDIKREAERTEQLNLTRRTRSSTIREEP